MIFMMGLLPGGFGQGMQDGRWSGMPPRQEGPSGGGQSYVNATGMKTFKVRRLFQVKRFRVRRKQKCCTGYFGDVGHQSLCPFQHCWCLKYRRCQFLWRKCCFARSTISEEGQGYYQFPITASRVLAKGANGVFPYGNGTVNSTNDYIYQTGGNARGVLCSGGGTVNIENDTIVTMSGSSSCIATDRGGGNVNVKGGIYTCNGTNSAGLYSTGNINASDATFISNGGEAMVIGKPTILRPELRLHQQERQMGRTALSEFSGDAEVGNKGHTVDDWRFLTYEGKKTGMFYNTNSTDSLYLNSVKLHNASDTLFLCQGRMG